MKRDMVFSDSSSSSLLGPNKQNKQYIYFYGIFVTKH